MLRLVSISEQTSTGVTFVSEEFDGENVVPYIIYDTSSGFNASLTEDYYAWRAVNALTSTGATTYEFTIDNSNLYPSTTTTIADYRILNPRLFRVMTLPEYNILTEVLVRLDLVRRRLPNPGAGLSSTDGIGENGVVSYAGGYEKKMTVLEIMYMIEAAIVDINGSSPRTFYWPAFFDADADKINNPYLRNAGSTMAFPIDLLQLVVLGTMLRCLIAVGILEVDISFSSSDSGLQLTFDRASQYKGWHDTLINDYNQQKSLFKWNHANHAGIGIGTVPWTATGPWGTLMNNASYGGTLGLQSVLGFSSRGNVQL
jgi:hypothetical protein